MRISDWSSDVCSSDLQPLVLGDAAQALALSQQLFEQGFWVAAIRPPTVPVGTSRLRITLSAAHRPAQIDALLDALATALRRSEEHTSELQSLMRISYAVFCLKKKHNKKKSQSTSDSSNMNTKAE